MPFKRKSFRRYRKSRKLPKRGRALALAKRNAIRLGRIRKTLRPEYKYKIFSVNSPGSTVLDYSGHYSNFTGPSQGTDVDDRIGNKIMLKGIWISGQIFRQSTPGSITDPDPVVRLTLVTYRDDAMPTFSEFFEPTAFLNSLQAVDMTFRQANRKLMKIWRDKKFVLKQGSSTTVPFKWFVRMNVPINFADNTTGSPDLFVGLCYVANSYSATGNQNPALWFAVKYIFTDV